MAEAAPEVVSFPGLEPARLRLDEHLWKWHRKDLLIELNYTTSRALQTENFILLPPLLLSLFVIGSKSRAPAPKIASEYAKRSSWDIAYITFPLTRSWCTSWDQTGAGTWGVILVCPWPSVAPHFKQPPLAQSGPGRSSIMTVPNKAPALAKAFTPTVLDPCCSRLWLRISRNHC